MTNIYLLVQDKIYNKVKRRIFCWHEVIPVRYIRRKSHLSAYGFLTLKVLVTFCSLRMIMLMHIIIHKKHPITNTFKNMTV